MADRGPLAGPDAAFEEALARVPSAERAIIEQGIARRVDRAVAEAARRLRVAQEAGRIGTYEICLTTGKTYGSPRFNEIFGLPADHNPLDARYWRSILHPDDRDDVLARTRNAIRHGLRDNTREYRIILNGEVRWVMSCDRVDQDENGAPTFAFGAIQDITDRKAYEALLWQAANEDPLTGLANRKRFREQLDAMLALGRRVGLLMVDLDRLKQANDDHGHAAGDHLIRSAAERIRDAAPGASLVGRLGGDEFAVATPVEDAPALTLIGDRIVGALRAPLRFGPVTLDCGGSAGGALYPDQARTAESLMNAADVALMVTKLTGRGRLRLWRPSEEAELARLSRARIQAARLAA